MFGRSAMDIALNRIKDSENEHVAGVHLQHKFSGRNLFLTSYDKDNHLAYGYDSQTNSYKHFSKEFLEQDIWLINTKFKHKHIEKLKEIESMRYKSVNNRDYKRDR